MKSSEIEYVKSQLIGRQQAYQQVFNPENIFTKDVMKDLARFCRGYKSTFHADPRLHAMLEGRREVFLRILYHTQLDPDQFWHYYGKGVPNE